MAAKMRNMWQHGWGFCEHLSVHQLQIKVKKEVIHIENEAHIKNKKFFLHERKQYE